MSFPIKKLLVFILLLFFGRIISQSKHFYNYENGLSNSLINEVFQDHLGFIWVATEDGLNRFDGIKFTTFTEEEHGLKANYVTTLTEDSNHNIWIGFINGLQKYNSDTETFTSVKIYIANTEIHPFVTGIIESKNGDIWIATSGHGLIRIPIEIGRSRYSTSLNNQLNSLFLRTIYEDQNGTLWLGSDDNGICTYAPATGVIKSYTHTKSANFQIPATSITSITGDKKGNIFIASLKEGLYKLNTQSKQVSRVFSPTHHKYQLPVKKIMFDSQNRLWVGTDGLGLYHYNQQTDKLIEYLPSNSTFDFSKSKIHCILEDHDGNIWTGIFQKGLYLFPETPSLFKHYGYRAFDPTSIGSSCVTALDGDALGLWIGTDGDGLYRISKDNNAVSHINLAQLTNDDANNTIFSLYDSNAKYLWIGTYSNGLIRYNKKTGNILSYKHNPQDAGSIPSDNIGCIQKGTENKLWIGTYSDGLISLNLNNNKFSKGFQIADSLNNLIPKIINDIYIDNHENIWLATYQGLVYFNAQNKSLSFYSTNNNFLPSNIIYCIHPDNKNNIWLGTYKGLVKINPANMSFSAYTKEDGIAGNVICAIQEDRYGQLWISTHTGLSRLNPSNNTFVNYYASDGLQSNEFYRNAVYKSADNSIYFGGINGVTEINKDYNLFISELPDIMLTNFMRFNTSVKIGTKTGKYTILNKSIVVQIVFICSKKTMFFPFLSHPKNFLINRKLIMST
ncbi:ligand-binding sensor domain-containing protein [Saccharicrinis fermentans]|uniref:Response regulator containing a CheY-like receiver domain and a GGDEF domain protein n=1 Tax=Saccharicrinis fermentans DSM 9555 = JCM 21142 TaxID=869213 RepID=W7Y4Y6_9BACT|nr:two-component regulator propeller domain-containing protein [Saccharicrinis fermentans]GAF03167.1 response regulator containing a CheY-like receiver domain and a GGDEF domain protein [Saccharicrinis fermentans DSM 9555 = JCM 21142]